MVDGFLGPKGFVLAAGLMLRITYSHRLGTFADLSVTDLLDTSDVRPSGILIFNVFPAMNNAILWRV